MLTIPNTVDHLLVPLDPGRALQLISNDFDRFVAMDPRIAAAGQLFEERLKGVARDRDALEPALWLHLRTRFQDPNEVEKFRRALGQPDAFLRSVQFALDTGFSVAALEEAADEVMRISAESSPATDLSQGSPPGSLIQKAREDLDRLNSARNVPLAVLPPFGTAILIACACAVLCYCIAAGIHWLAEHYG